MTALFPRALVFEEVTWTRKLCKIFIYLLLSPSPHEVRVLPNIIYELAFTHRKTFLHRFMRLLVVQMNERKTLHIYIFKLLLFFVVNSLFSFGDLNMRMPPKILHYANGEIYIKFQNQHLFLQDLCVPFIQRICYILKRNTKKHSLKSHGSQKQR